MSKIVKSSTHTTKFTNTGKQVVLSDFLIEYNRAIWWYVDYLWTTKIEWLPGRILDVKRNKLDVPDFISTANTYFNTELSSRAIKLASAEALAIVKSQVEHRRKQLYVLSKKMSEGFIKDVKYLQRKIDSNPLIKPSHKSNYLSANLDSNCCFFTNEKTSEFDGFLKLHALGKKYGHIYIPVKFTKHSNKFKNNEYELMSSWQINTDSVKSRWKKDVVTSTGNKIIGADQGKVTCLSLSDGQATTTCNHGHDLTSIIAVMNRCKKGSKGYKRKQEHRTNYINWSINHLDLDGVGELRLEKLFQMRKGVNVGSALSHWTYTQINAQIESRCEALGVRVVEQSAIYRSQRCSKCGWTQKSNRKGKEFKCKCCKHEADADLNGALNHEADLYRLPFGIRELKLNKNGFYWLENGIFDSFGQEITVPVVQKDRT